MADKTIAAAATLTALTIADGDQFPLSDVSAAVGSKASKITKDELMAAVLAYLAANSLTITSTAPQITLGANTTTLGAVKLFGSTSGSVTLQPAAIAGTAVVVTQPNASSTLPIFGQQVTFTGPTAARSYVLPDAADTLASLAASNTYTGTTNSFTIPTTTGVTTASGVAFNANSLTTGTGLYLASSTLTSGKALDIQVSGTAAAANQTALNILTSGANGTSAITSKGAVISNIHTGTTSTNIALELNASGGATINTALRITAGNIISAADLMKIGLDPAGVQNTYIQFRGANDDILFVGGGTEILHIYRQGYLSGGDATDLGKSGGAGFRDMYLVRNAVVGGTLAVTGTTTLGTGTSIKNIRHGVSGAMVSGVVTVTDTGCTTNTRYFFTVHTIGTVAIPSTYYVTTRNASTSFVVTASVLTDTSTLDWMAIEP